MRRLLSVLLLLSTVALPVHARMLQFSGYTWYVRDSGISSPGPNRWSDRNAWVDRQGRLHLRISRRGNTWHCAEVFLDRPLGYGTYEFKLVGRPDQLDRNVVLGLFNYLGTDMANEIDIEFARWGDLANPAGYWTVYPASTGPDATTWPYMPTLNGEYSTHRFHWRPERVDFQALHGHQNGNDYEFQRWTFAPPDPQARIPQTPMPVHMNLWLFEGQPPSNGREVEIVISEFRFTPAY